jgi:HD superfamily phosphohydrolase
MPDPTHVIDLPFPLERAVAIQDPVHGRVWLTDVERAVIETPEFQRLRNIIQLGPAHYVFPGATHNRHTHSIGACHVMGMALGQPNLQEYLADRPGLVQLMRLAALLHDIGHLPFSHIGEDAYSAQVAGVIDEYHATHDMTAYDGAAKGGPREALHEQLTAKIVREPGSAVRKVLDELPEFDGHPAAEVVADIIEGTFIDVVCRNLISSDLDCDRLDYLLRDSGAAGIDYGRIDLAYLLENLTVARPEGTDPVLAVDPMHGRLAVEHYLVARYYYYAQFVFHKTVSAAEISLSAAMLELIRQKKLPSTFVEVEEMACKPAFLAFDDVRVLSLLQDALRDRRRTVLREAAEAVLHRRLMKCAYRLDGLEQGDGGRDGIVLDRMFLTHKAQRATARDAGVPVQAFCYRRLKRKLVGTPATASPTEVLRHAVDFEKSSIKGVKLAVHGGQPQELVSQEGLIGTLSDRTWVTRRVYVRDPSHRDRIAAYIKSELAS